MGKILVYVCDVKAIGYKAVKLDWNNFKAFFIFRLDIVPEELKLMRWRRPGPRRGA